MAPPVATTPPGLEAAFHRSGRSGRGGVGKRGLLQSQERPAPPGVRKAKNGALRSLDAAFEESHKVAEEDVMSRLSEDVLRAVVEEVDADVLEKLQSIWRCGALDVKQMQLQSEQSTDLLMQSVATFKTAQDSLEAENLKLRQLLTTVSDQFALLSSRSKLQDPWSIEHGTDACSTPTTCATPNGCPGLWPTHTFSMSDSAGVFTPAGSDCCLPQTPSSTELPPSKQAAATLSLADALGLGSPKKETRSAPQTPSRQLPPSPPQHAAPSAMDLEEAADAFIFNLTLRVADAANLGLGLSPCGMLVRIDSVTPGSAADAWNRQCSSSALLDRVLLVGDQIVSVNDISGDPCSMVLECSRAKLLRLQVLRPGLSVVDGQAPEKLGVQMTAQPPHMKRVSSPLASPPRGPPPASPPPASPVACPPPPPPMAPPSFAVSEKVFVPPPFAPAGTCEFAPMSFPQAASSPYASPMASQSGGHGLLCPPSSPPPLGCPPPLPMDSFSAGNEPPPPPSLPPGPPGLSSYLQSLAAIDIQALL
eukprot:TRINITY_DN105829_c0_g1_i1.p1 TRINITY_DN105829_c0_g1~~TRINITY_DN105829_c0_g1_i1.p1  ORF type:complete len:534 (-),score=110.41 TRINITY_DN105829_c0_g1_i1:229-1830(-)